MKYPIYFFAICGAQHHVFFVSVADNGHSSALNRGRVVEIDEFVALPYVCSFRNNVDIIEH